MRTGLTSLHLLHKKVPMNLSKALWPFNSPMASDTSPRLAREGKQRAHGMPIMTWELQVLPRPLTRGCAVSRQQTGGETTLIGGEEGFGFDPRCHLSQLGLSIFKIQPCHLQTAPTSSQKDGLHCLLGDKSMRGTSPSNWVRLVSVAFQL